jgi:single-strand DNA-binding protein
MIRAAVTGRLGGDPTPRKTAKGAGMATANVAVDVAREGAEPATEWIGLVGFGAAADALLRCKKGDVITAVGPLTKATFTGRDGEARSNWSMRIDQLVSARDRPPPPRSRVPANAAGRPRSPYPSNRFAADARRPFADDRVDDLWPEDVPA